MIYIAVSVEQIQNPRIRFAGQMTAMIGDENPFETSRKKLRFVHCPFE